MNKDKIIRIVDLPSRIKPIQTVYERLFKQMKDKEAKQGKTILMPWDENSIIK